MFKIGQKVRIKPYDKIKKTLDAKNMTHEVLFVSEMIYYCGKVVKITSTVSISDRRKIGFKVSGNSLTWVKEWLEDDLKDKLDKVLND